MENKYQAERAKIMKGGKTKKGRISRGRKQERKRKKIAVMWVFKSSSLAKKGPSAAQETLASVFRVKTVPSTFSSVIRIRHPW